MNSFLLSVITATLFLGGWRGPFVNSVPLLGTLWVLVKALAVFFVLLWLWGTMPRLRIDQMLSFNWKFLVPISLANVCMLALVGKALPPDSSAWVQAGALLGSNVLLVLVVLVIMIASGRRARKQQMAIRG
jgi:NADH-quinone oxidoreductase subunit H